MDVYIYIVYIYIIDINRSYILYTYIDVVEYIHSYKLLFSHEKFSIFPGCTVLMTPLNLSAPASCASPSAVP